MYQQDRDSGLTYREIGEKYGVKGPTISSQLRNPLICRAAAARYEAKYPVRVKIRSFHHHTPKSQRVDGKFTVSDFLSKIGTSPRCYLTGTPIDLENRKSYAIDHIIPTSKGGTNCISNANLIRADANMVKTDKTLAELYTICEEILARRALHAEIIDPNLL